MNGLGHRAECRAAVHRVSRTQVLDQVCLGPRADTRRLVTGEVIRPPAFSHATGELAPVIERLQRSTRSMAVAAVSQRLDQVRAAVPLGAAVGDRLEALVGVVETRPQGHQPALVVGSLELGLRRHALHRRDRGEILADRHDVVVREVRVGGIRESRIQACPIRGNALVHGFEEIRVVPRADTSFLVRRDVR